MALSKEQLTREYQELEPQLRSFVLRISGSLPDTGDILQDTYERALRYLEGFQGKSSLKTWLFSIASNVARDNLKVRRRWLEDVTDHGRVEAMQDPVIMKEMGETGAEGAYEVADQIAFCFSCVSKSLPLEQQICLLLKEAHDFRIAEIAVIIGRNEQMVKYYLHQGRKKMMEIFDRRCSLVSQRGMCEQCSELSGLFNPEKDVQQELMKIALVREARNRDKEHLFRLRTDILRSVDPLKGPGAAIRQFQLRLNSRLMEELQEN